MTYIGLQANVSPDMSPSCRPSFLSLPLLLLTALPLPAADPAPLTESAWESASTFRSNEAYAEFSKVLSKKDANRREVILGQAAALIGVQPKTEGNINTAVEMCQKLVQENPGDTVGLLANFLLARIEQYHRQPANPQKAAEIYRQLLREHPESLVAQISSSKLAVLLLFSLTTAPDELKKNLEELDAILAKMPLVESRRDTLVVMGNACILFKLGDERALRYLIDAESAQIPSIKLRGDILLQIGSTAQKLNRKDVALKYYGMFVDQYRRDARNYMVRQKIAQLKSGS